MFKLLALCCVTWQIVASCGNLSGHQKLDLDRYQGTWNLIGFVEPQPYEGNIHRCVSESYARRSDNPHLMDTVWNGTIDNERVSTPGIIAVPSPFSWGASKWDFYMDGVRFDTTILATNYVDWAIEHTCAITREPEQAFERLMIRSRTSSLPAEVLQTLMSVAESFDFNIDDFVFIDQTNCM